MDTRSLLGCTALITGAASGIGRATALALARAGADLVLCDVNEAGLADTAAAARGLGRTVIDRRVDVSSRDQMRAFAAEVHGQRGAVDILVNNAGVGLGATFQDTLLEDWDWIVGINLFGVVHGCHFFIPPMVARGQGGHVVNVASTSSYAPSASLVAYSTTKFAVLGLSEALREELEPHGIGVTAVCPGLINTRIVETARMRGRMATPEARRIGIQFYRWRNYSPERVATKILKAIRRNRTVVPISPEAWLFYYAKRLAPSTVRRLNRLMSAQLERRLKPKSA